MSEDLFTKISDLEKKATKKQKILARYFLSHSEELSFQTAAVIAKKTGLSEPTIIRFARALGYNGFPQLKEEFQKIILSKLSPSERLHRTFDATSDVRKITDLMFETEIRNLRETHNSLNLSQIKEIVNYIIEANRKFVIGLRTSSGCAYILGRLLGYSLPDIICILQDGIHVYEELRKISKGDVLIAISYPRYIRTTVDAIRIGNDRGARTIAITDWGLSPAAQISQFAIIAPSTSISISNSYTACLSAINVLFTLITKMDRTQTEATLREWENMVGSFDFFYK